MNIWAPSNVQQIEVVNWMIVEVEIDEITSRHIIGFNVTESEGRVSSPIVLFDSESRICITRSGRIYKLTGKLSLTVEPHSQYVWAVWKHNNKVKDYKVVSNEYIE